MTKSANENFDKNVVATCECGRPISHAINDGCENPEHYALASDLLKQSARAVFGNRAFNGARQLISPVGELCEQIRDCEQKMDAARDSITKGLKSIEGLGYALEVIWADLQELIIADFDDALNKPSSYEGKNLTYQSNGEDCDEFLDEEEYYEEDFEE